MQFQRNDKEIFGSSLQKLSAQKKTFQWTDARNCVYFSPQNLLFYADKSILRAVIWLVLLMHASYSNYIGYNETPTLTVLNGPPSWVVRSASKKRPIRISIQTVVTPGPDAINTFFMLNLQRDDIFLVINFKMPTFVGILKFLTSKMTSSDILSSIMHHRVYILIIMEIKLFMLKCEFNMVKFYSIGFFLLDSLW